MVEDGITLARADEVEPEDVHWIPGLENQMAYGLMTALVGMPGVNKTTWACRAAGMVSRANGGVLIVSAEDSPSVLRGRLEASKSVLDHCYFGSVTKNGLTGNLILLPEDVVSLEQTIVHNNIKLLVLDPVQAHFGRDIDSNRDQSVRTALAPLAAVGIRHHCAILLLMHLNKGHTRDPFTRAGGSIGIPAISRVCLIMAAHPEAHPDENLRVVTGFKNAYGPLAQADIFRLQLASVPDYDDLQINLSWEGNGRFTPEWLLSPRRIGDAG